MCAHFLADVNEYRLEKNFDVIYSSGVLHYIRAARRPEILQNYKEHVNPGGLAALQVFVHKPFLAPAPEKEQTDPWYSGELVTCFHDWRINECTEYIFDCNSSSVPHQHATNHLFAHKPI